MRAVTKDINLAERGESFNLYPIGDTHIGAAQCDEAALKALVAEVAADPKGYWLGMGDLPDAIGRNVGDKRAEESALAPWLHGEMRVFEKQRERVIETFKPIASKCLGLLEGNHEHAALHYHGTDMYYAVAEALQREGGQAESLALGYLGFVRLRFRYRTQGASERKDNGGDKSYPYTIVAHHGWGGGRKAGAKALKLEDMCRLYDADIYLMGHVHSEIPLKGVRLAVSTQGKIQERQWVSVMTGTFLRGHDLNSEASTYAEIAGYPPTTIGSPRITIQPATGKLKVTV